MHWLPVEYRVEYKLALLVFKSLHGAAPEYLGEYCVGVASSRGDLRVRKTKTCFGDRAFSVAGPKCWKSIPPSIRSPANVDSFKTGLKTHYFKMAYL